MARITITEALAEIKTVGKRIQSKQIFIGPYIARHDKMKDPLENQGGSPKIIKAERQAITDLEERIVVIRAAISKANSQTAVTLGDRTRSVADWLVWRREVAQGRKQFLSGMRDLLRQLRQTAAQKSVIVRTSDAPSVSPEDVIVNVDEKALSDEIEMIDKTLGDLDGQLSLKDATTFVEV